MIYKFTIFARYCERIAKWKAAVFKFRNTSVSEARYINGKQCKTPIDNVLFAKTIINKENEKFFNPLGNVSKAMTVWKERASKFIVKTLEKGVELKEKKRSRRRKRLKNPKTNEQNEIAMTQLIEEELRMDVIEEIAEEEAEIINPVFIVRTGAAKKARKILNVKQLNKNLFSKKLKTPGIREACKQIPVNSWCTVLDVKKAYFHIPIHEQSRKLLGFSWQGKTYRHKALPFGLNSAPYWWQKVFREVESYIKQQGINIFVYMDDILIIANSKQEAALHHQRVKQILQEFGISTNEKEVATPTQKVQYLGFKIDSKAGIIKPTKDKMRQTRRKAYAMQKRKNIPKRALAQFLGHAMAMTAGIPDARTKTQELYICMNRSYDWEDLVTLSKEAREELFWWQKLTMIRAGASFITHPIDTRIATDASPWGWGATFQSLISKNPTCLHAHGYFHGSDRNFHINIKEAMAIHRTLLSFKERIHKKSIMILCDSQAVVGAMKKRFSPSKKLRETVNAVWKLAAECQCELYFQHIAGSTNTVPDYLSRLTYTEDYKVKDEFVSAVAAEVGSINFDRFATDTNKQTPLFNSLYWCPGSAGINSLAQCWRGYHNWVNPPFSIYEDVTRHIIAQQAECTCVIPYWPRSSWWLRKLIAISDAAFAIPQHLELYEGAFQNKSLPQNAWLTFILHIPPNPQVVSPATLQERSTLLAHEKHQLVNKNNSAHRRQLVIPLWKNHARSLQQPPPAIQPKTTQTHETSSSKNCKEAGYPQLPSWPY